MRYTIQYGKNPDAPQATATLFTPPTNTPDGQQTMLTTALRDHFTGRSLLCTRRPSVHNTPAHGRDDAGFFHIEHRYRNIFGQWWAEQGDNE